MDASSFQVALFIIISNSQLKCGGENYTIRSRLQLHIGGGNMFNLALTIQPKERINRWSSFTVRTKPCAQWVAPLTCSHLSLSNYVENIKTSSKRAHTHIWCSSTDWVLHRVMPQYHTIFTPERKTTWTDPKQTVKWKSVQISSAMTKDESQPQIKQIRQTENRVYSDTRHRAQTQTHRRSRHWGQWIV